MARDPDSTTALQRRDQAIPAVHLKNCSIKLKYAHANNKNQYRAGPPGRLALGWVSMTRARNVTPGEPATTTGNPAFVIARARPGEFRLSDASGVQRASMTVFGIAAGAEIRTASGPLTASRQGWRTVIATYQGGRSGSIRLDRRSTRLPGDTAIQTWQVHRRWRYYEGTLHSPAKSMTLRLAPFSGRLCTVDIDGDWNDVEAVSLTACYALLVRRKLDQIIMVTAGH